MDTIGRTTAHRETAAESGEGTSRLGSDQSAYDKSTIHRGWSVAPPNSDTWSPPAAVKGSLIGSTS